MIVRSEKPKRPIDQVSPVELLNSLFVALSNVINYESILAEFENGRLVKGTELEEARDAIRNVSNLYRNLEKRSDIDDLVRPLEELSDRTGLDMRQFLNECLEFPNVIPYARTTNGLRRIFTCFCGRREAVDRHGLGLCLECLNTALICVKEKRRQPGFVLYRAYSLEVRCRHADFDTVLITIYKKGQWLPAWCETCLLQEKQRIDQLQLVE